MGTQHELVAAIDASAASSGLSLDPAQQRLRDRLAHLGAGLAGTSLRRRSTPRGLYIHGPAGRGKSWLADAFYAAVPTTKTRVHFHRFFDELHRNIHLHRNEREAVDQAINEVTGASCLLLFDELHVHDSGDARLLTRLLMHAFRRRMTVLATSNYAPDDLLPNPIWHHTFEPGIDLIKTNMDIFHVHGVTDYRTTCADHSVGFAAGRWTTRTTTTIPQHGQAAVATVRGRDFPMLAIRPGELWASFAQLCDSPTSTIEYLEWSRTFAKWTITDIPLLRDVNLEAQQRFITLIDVLVDAGIRVTFVSTHDLTTFLTGAAHRPDAFRMTSRLHLLRSSDPTAPWPKSDDTCTPPTCSPIGGQHRR
ncbi:cell division protein ZapE [Gordonia insulae]|uniref:Cell division protein ZapE n=1 Tax=Gordonia insulae TaxID=2420509 RepID=A0A3G8JI30_9ACTN|nr:cell division protein ZapE [Gordonia insulae]AZG44578.1 Cell division protein ZapE [Gordonia insulae]